MADRFPQNEPSLMGLDDATLTEILGAIRKKRKIVESQIHQGRNELACELEVPTILGFPRRDPTVKCRKEKE